VPAGEEETLGLVALGFLTTHGLPAEGLATKRVLV
jgi:hypothetical protein